MNKFSEIIKEKDSQRDNCYRKNNDQLGELEAFVIGLARLWFSGEKFRQEISRDLNIKFGYFKGYQVSRSVNKLFSFIHFHQPLITVNSSDHITTTTDEKRIAQLVFPNNSLTQSRLHIAKTFVPTAEIKTLVRLAKMVNLSLV